MRKKVLGAGKDRKGKKIGCTVPCHPPAVMPKLEAKFVPVNIEIS